jgi:hypothetical protein
MTAGVIAVMALAPSMAWAARKPAPPRQDLTKEGVEVNTKNDFNLGPTGARGWMYVKSTGITVGSLTGEARQILITKIDNGSPADGVLQVGDVVLGVEGKLFDDDARKCFGRAITRAEEEKNRGRLKLIVWRGGRKQDVSLKLRVMGSYSDTSPYDCPKAARILEDGYRYLLEHPKAGNRFHMKELALMASGREEFLDEVRKAARSAAPPDLVIDWKTGTNTGGKVAWGWGYRTLFLAEYYLLTGDKTVLPALKVYATNVALSQSAVGTWGHTGAPTALNDGRLHGPLTGYGALNQAGLVCAVSLVLARECGLENQELDDAIKRSNLFFSYYVGKGSIPYGDHRPSTVAHDDNGKNSLAAILFDLQGHREGARFFSRMVTASSEDREWGHTGNQFSTLWGAMGANRGGPKAVAALMKEQRWYFDLLRCWDGGFVYQPVGGGGRRDGYSSFSSTGTFLLSYALPMRNLFITGKGAERASRSHWLDAAQVAGAIEAGVRASAYAGRSTGDLFECLASWSPVVRHHAAGELARRKDEKDLVARLMRTLEGGEPNARVGACWALGRLRGGAAPAVPLLAKLLSDKDVWLRVNAGYALRDIGKAAKPAVPEMLEALALRRTDDPREFQQRGLAFALFYPGGAVGPKGLLADSLDGIDRDRLYPAIRRVMRNDDGRARGCLRSTYNLLTLEDIRELADDIVYSVEEKAPSGIMFAKGVRLAGVELLAKHHAREGLRLSLEAMGLGQWGQGYQTGVCLGLLKQHYRGAAREILPELKALREHPHFKGFKDNRDKLLELIELIENDPNPPSLINLKDVGLE